MRMSLLPAWWCTAGGGAGQGDDERELHRRAGVVLGHSHKMPGGVRLVTSSWILDGTYCMVTFQNKKNVSLMCMVV